MFAILVHFYDFTFFYFFFFNLWIFNDDRHLSLNYIHLKGLYAFNIWQPISSQEDILQSFGFLPINLWKIKSNNNQKYFSEVKFSVLSNPEVKI